jgi:hypothetical protein
MMKSTRRATVRMALAAALIVAGFPGVAQAFRDAGVIDTGPPLRPDPAPAATDMATGVIDGMRVVHPRGPEVQIAGRWWLVLPGRTQVLRNGVLVDEKALTAGQRVRFLPASKTPGETALGIVHVL